jgi:hypothetical protein
VLLVTGSPRSGTGYASAAFTAQGVPIGHEQLHTRGISAWQWAVYADEYPWMTDLKRDCTITTTLHQVRNPLQVIASLGVLKAKDWGWIEDIIGDLPLEDLEGRCVFWLDWTHRCDQIADYRYRVEDFEQGWPELHKRTGGIKEWQAGHVSRRTNTRPHMDISWDDIARCDCGGRVIRRAREYGYEVTI